MSFLSDLRTKQQSLKPTNTTIRFLDGRQFIVSGHSTSIEISRSQYGFVVDTKPDDIASNVIDGIFLGSQDCCSCEVLSKYKIKYVLSIGIKPPVECDSVIYKFVQCLDLPEVNLKCVLKECVGFIEIAVGENCNILVHCNAGVSRSAAVVIGYLMTVRQFCYSDAYYIVRNSRNCVRPNDGFVRQLKELENK